MPSRYTSCSICDNDIDRDAERFHQVDCECCQHCGPCALERGEDLNAGYEFAAIPRARSRPTATVHYYSYKPSPYLPKGNYPAEVLMGLELEVGGISDYIGCAVKEIDPNEDHLYVKSDCSIYGAEIVTHPMTLAWAREYPFAELLNKLRGECWTNPCQCGQRACEYGWECACGDPSCYRCRDRHETGLHIHVSRNAFRQARKRAKAEQITPDETYEQRVGRELREMRRIQREQEAINHQMIWLMFLERNSDKIAGTTKLARREQNHYSKFKKSELKELRQKGTEAPYFGEDRYMAINCQNDKTYELRFFSSTLDTEEFYGALEFVDASVEYTRKLNADDVLRSKSLHWAEFVEWVKERDYPNLLSQIVTLGIEA